MPKSAPKRRLVVDTNYLARDELREFLAASGLHYAVLTEFAAMESYKGNTLKSIFPNMSVLIDFPKQVIVLKGAEITQTFIDRVSNPQRRLIDPDGAASFSRFAEALKNPNERVKRELVEKGALADSFMKRMAGEAAKFSQTLPVTMSIYDKTEQMYLRKQEGLPDELARKVMKEVMTLAAHLLRLSKVTRAPSFDELLDTLAFRESVCIYIWSLRTMQGKYPTNPEKIRNSVIDCTFAAYATYFDGLMTAEAMPMDVYRTATNWITAMKNAK